MSGSEFDTAFARLNGALADAGVEPLTPPPDTEQLDSLDDALHPLRLPAELRAFWERADVTAATVAPFPQLVAPGFALDQWIEARRALPRQAAVLLLVGAQSWTCLSVELDSPSASGGAVFEWALDSIRDVLDSDPSAPLEITIAGRVVGLSCGRGEFVVRLDDGTGHAVLRGRESATALGPVMGERFDFDVSVGVGPRDGGPDHPPAPMTVTAVRPVD